MERPEIKDGDCITAKIFNDIYDTIDKVENECKQEVSDILNNNSEFQNIKYEIMNLQEEETKSYRYIKALQAIIIVMGIFILISLLCIILGVF